jgi:4-hydroxybenzoate polyprenyltransferase
MLTAYAAERLPLRLLLPVAALLALAGAARRWPGMAAFTGDAVFALLLFAQFRMWDDLADLPRDRARRLGRVLCGAASVRPVVLAVIALGIANLALAALRDPSGRATMALVALHVAVAALYRGRRRRTLAGDRLLLAKYPAFVFVLAGPRVAESPVTLSLAMAAVYLGACLYEAWHDGTSPLARHRRLVALDGVLLLGSLAVLIWAHLPGGHS